MMFVKVANLIGRHLLHRNKTFGVNFVHTLLKTNQF